MELKDFIKEVVLEIIEGVKLSQKEINKRGINAMINPTINQASGISFEGEITDYSKTNTIEIEASITTSNEGSAGASIKVLSGDYKNKTENFSKVKFSIPILLPPPILLKDLDN